MPAREKPSTFSDNTGNTQGIRFRISPPTSAKTTASAKPGGAAAGAGVTSALPSAGAAAGAAGAGQGVVTATATRRPAAWPALVSTTGIVAGDSVRCGSTGTRAVQVPSAQAVCGFAALTITPGVSGRKPSSRPCQAAGSPATRTTSSPPCNAASARAPGTSCGRAARAASNSAACPAVAALTGSFSVNSPLSGMQTSLHTSHSAANFTVSVSPARPAGTISATGSSRVPS